MGGDENEKRVDEMNETNARVRERGRRDSEYERGGRTRTREGRRHIDVSGNCGLSRATCGCGARMPEGAAMSIGEAPALWKEESVTRIRDGEWVKESSQEDTSKETSKREDERSSEAWEGNCEREYTNTLIQFGWMGWGCKRRNEAEDTKDARNTRWEWMKGKESRARATSMDTDMKNKTKNWVLEAPSGVSSSLLQMVTRTK